jgi:PKD repeat protein
VAGTYQVTLTALNSGTATSSVTYPVTPLPPP